MIYYTNNTVTTNNVHKNNNSALQNTYADLPKEVILGNNLVEISSAINIMYIKQLSIPNDAKSITNQYTITFYLDEDVKEFKKLLTNSYENKVFTFKNIKFDFTNYDRKLVDTLIDHINRIDKFVTIRSIL